MCGSKYHATGSCEGGVRKALTLERTVIQQVIGWVIGLIRGLIRGRVRRWISDGGCRGCKSSVNVLVC